MRRRRSIDSDSQRGDTPAMHRSFIRHLLLIGLCTAAGGASAHFQMLIPSTDMVTSPAERQLRLDVKFWHPFEGHGMDIEAPVQFGVRSEGKNIDLRSSLKPQQITDATGKKRNGFQVDYAIRKPGDLIFYVEPKPFWEPAEEVFIVHYTKVIVIALGLERGWDDELGLKTEIVPLTRPYGLYTGNVFQGIVKLNGKAAPYSEVEVEYYNESGKLKAPADPMITQVVKADGNGVFTYAMPKAGWWGFAARHVTHAVPARRLAGLCRRPCRAGACPSRRRLRGRGAGRGPALVQPRGRTFFQQRPGGRQAGQGRQHRQVGGELHRRQVDGSEPACAGARQLQGHLAHRRARRSQGQRRIQLYRKVTAPRRG